MGSGAGHVFDMINRMKQNRAQRTSQRGKFKENNRDGIYSDSEIKPERPNFRTVPEKELLAVKKLIRKRAKAEQKRTLILYGAFVFCGLLLLIALLIWMN